MSLYMCTYVYTYTYVNTFTHLHMQTQIYLWHTLNFLCPQLTEALICAHTCGVSVHAFRGYFICANIPIRQRLHACTLTHGCARICSRVNFVYAACSPRCCAQD